MARDLRLRFAFTRRGLARAMGWALVFALPAALMSQNDPGRSLTFTTFVPAVPMGGFGTLVVNGGAADPAVSLARDGASASGGGGRVAIGQIGAADPQETLVVAPRASFGANASNDVSPTGAAAAQVYSSAVNPANTAGVGMFVTDVAPARWWSLHVERKAGEGFDSLWLERNNTKVFGITPNGTMRVCRWTTGACSAGGSQDIMIYSGTGPSPDNATCGCPCGSFRPPAVPARDQRCRSCNAANGQPGFSEFYACPPAPGFMTVASGRLPAGWSIWRLCCSLRRT